MGDWLEGQVLARKIRDEVKEEVEHFLKKEGASPSLVGILIGANKASMVYLRMKEKRSKKLGIRSEILNFPQETTRASLMSKINELNLNKDVDGILVQLPLPASFNTYEVISSILPEKDVDGFHPFNLGSLLMNQEGLKPCTPLGIMELLKSRDVPIEGKRVVIIGRSFIVGKPLAAMMTNEHGTVTICHSRTKILPQVAFEADILVAAIGRGALVTPDFVKEGAVVVDVGQNFVTTKTRAEELFGQDEKRKTDLEEKGYTIVGDVHPQVIEKAKLLTPVPGGVGPLTVALLMRNTLEAFKKRRGF
ncbi:bifunctional 5,10-methylenetetrahydrofolate dehydrogenase/5,10-methenyltetrahydrofolate cyclohydrolase [Acidobacteriota bacterium]